MGAAGGVAGGVVVSGGDNLCEDGRALQRRELLHGVEERNAERVGQDVDVGLRERERGGEGSVACRRSKRATRSSQATARRALTLKKESPRHCSLSRYSASLSVFVSAENLKNSLSVESASVEAFSTLIMSFRGTSNISSPPAMGADATRPLPSAPMVLTATSLIAAKPPAVAHAWNAANLCSGFALAAAGSLPSACADCSCVSSATIAFSFAICPSGSPRHAPKSEAQAPIALRTPWSGSPHVDAIEKNGSSSKRGGRHLMRAGRRSGPALVGERRRGTRYGDSDPFFQAVRRRQL